MQKKTICLAMIVKNEATVIERCLTSVLPLIDHWIICDTGSTDGTQDVVRNFFQQRGIPGTLHERPWQDFAHNRTESLVLARPHGDYTLIIDADDRLVLPPGFKRPFLNAESYTVTIVQDELRYRRPQLIRSALAWRYEGVLHEFICRSNPKDGQRLLPESGEQKHLAGVQIHMGHDGARRRLDSVVRFSRDAEIIADALTKETDPFHISRYTFYLAQSHFQSGQKEEAVAGFLRRADLGFWEQERYISLYRAAKIQADLGYPSETVLTTFDRATKIDPQRAEAFHGAAKYCRERKLYQDGYKIAKKALSLRQPDSGLFVEKWIYDYGLLDEFAVNAYWVGDYRGSLDACRRLLALGRRLPEHDHQRIEKNADYAKQKLREERESGISKNNPAVVARSIDESTAQKTPEAVNPLPTISSRPAVAQQSRPRTRSKTLHILGVAHTIPHPDYSVCAFTAKILQFPDIICPFGWHVIEYSNEGSVSRAHEHVTIFSRDRLQSLSKRRSREEPMDADVTNEPLQQEFKKILLEKIRLKAHPGDIVCHVIAPEMDVYHALPHCHHVEMSVGYKASPGLPFRIYESSAWMHWHHGKAGRDDGSNYNWVIPSGFDIDAWPYCAEPENYAVFLGRVVPRKGISTLIDIAKRLPSLQIRVYGPGDTSAWQANCPTNLVFKGPVFGAERVEVVRRARCMLMPTGYIEPFGFSAVEAQLCGVPVIGTSFGAFQETILDGITGYRCHTLADWLQAIALCRSLDRRTISDIARRKCARDTVGRQYDWALDQLSDLSGTGWYGDVSRKFEKSQPVPVPLSPSRIWIYMPYFGALPNYFQLYLDSLARNADCLTVVLLTDIDLTHFTLPENLLVLPMTLDEMRHRAARLLKDNCGVTVDPSELIKNPYKLVDFKITYPDMFHDISTRIGVQETDFVGWGDCDLIYGRLSDFPLHSAAFDIVGGFHGHLTAFRNSEQFRKLYTTVPDLPRQLCQDNALIMDEIAFRQPMLDFLDAQKLSMFFIHRYFCDVVPNVFFGMFRKDHAERKKNFFDVYNADREIDHIRCDKDGRLTVIYEDGSKRETIYCHLQKRRMTLACPDPAQGYKIEETAFTPLI